MPIKPLPILQSCWNKLSRSYNSWDPLPLPRADIAGFSLSHASIKFHSLGALRQWRMVGNVSWVEWANTVSQWGTCSWGSPWKIIMPEKTDFFFRKKRLFQMHRSFKMICSLSLVCFCSNIPVTSLGLLILQNQYLNLSIWTSVRLCL